MFGHVQPGFSPETRETVRSRVISKFGRLVNEDDGSPLVTPAEYRHVDHSRGSDRRDCPTNCLVGDAIHHYWDHIRSALDGWDNGLTGEQNMQAIQTLWERIPDEYRKGLPAPDDLGGGPIL
jgi:hypothetical protein